MEFYFITRNRHKLEEASAALKPYGISLRMPPPGIPKLEIQDQSLEKIALLAARHAYQRLLAPLIAEDAGLFIDALNGFPGPYSSYIYRTIGVEGILRLMRGVGNRRARFKSAVACIYPPYEEVFVGVAEGTITSSPRGEEGFGFDPIFIPSGENRTFAEMRVEEKNRFSHRAKAFRILGEWLRGFRRKT